MALIWVFTICPVPMYGLQGTDGLIAFYGKIVIKNKLVNNFYYRCSFAVICLDSTI